ncbi:hypothetical protein PoB_005098400 [Plakobranchus ocellatus]|uniref:Uncharacterized protein n=1 Tax=Plakobranchus ocellatus TaxID=259542 RepID=A0AAV4C1B7_9GAST|nr:hypothetical protein PoB_005098400 [Plakobranchus ocellatus]
MEPIESSKELEYSPVLPWECELCCHTGPQFGPKQQEDLSQALVRLCFCKLPLGAGKQQTFGPGSTKYAWLENTSNFQRPGVLSSCLRVSYSRFVCGNVERIRGPCHRERIQT